MKLKTNTPEYYNDISESIRAFESVDTIELTDGEADITVMCEKTAEGIRATCGTDGFFGEYTEKNTTDKYIKRCVKLSVYYAMKQKTGRELPWGSLTGIRPTKLLREFDGDINALNKIYDLPLNKGELLKRIVDNQAEFFTPAEDEIDVYVGIPFCRTRCSYCSFSSTDSVKGEKLMIPYVDTLLREIDDTAELMKRLNKKVRCVYIGGGTPTALTESLFDKMLSGVCGHFKPAVEFTVEAGRPDTITEHKLIAMKQAGVDRISINPQSMNGETLKKIGRSHSPEEICECFAIARKIGFNTINCDLIAGLPDETPEMFFYTLDRVLELNPENITVHTLALKHGSVMFEKGYKADNQEAVRLMVEGAQDILTGRGFEPYYLYRQKYMTGNFENIGYAKKGHIGIYNIDIMEETTDITALGCGGASKRLFKSENRIERAFNYKSIYEYNSNPLEAKKRKEQLFLI